MQKDIICFVNDVYNRILKSYNIFHSALYTILLLKPYVMTLFNDSNLHYAELCALIHGVSARATQWKKTAIIFAFNLRQYLITNAGKMVVNRERKNSRRPSRRGRGGGRARAVVVRLYTHQLYTKITLHKNSTPNDCTRRQLYTKNSKFKFYAN